MKLCLARGSVALIASAVLGAVLLAPAGASAGEAVGGGGAPPAVANASANESAEMKLRREMGFADSLTMVREARQRFGDTARHSEGIGIPLAPEEMRQVAARRLLTNKTPKAVEIAQRMAGYGGAWFEQSGDGRLHVLLTQPGKAADRAAIEAAVDGAGPVVFDMVQTPRSELEAVFTKILADKSEWAAKGVDIGAVAIDDQRNEIEIGIYPTSSENATTLLQQSYSTVRLAIRQGSGGTDQGARDITTGPLYGGMWLTAGRSRCTAGYAKVTKDLKYYAITAGHCAGPIGTEVQQGYYRLSSGYRSPGTILKNSWKLNGGSSTCDCAVFGPLPSGFATRQVLVDNNQLYYYTSSAPVIQNQSICHTGAQSYESKGHIICGIVTKVTDATDSTTPTGATYTCTDCFRASTSGFGGDSGAPYGNGRNFHGIHRGEDFFGSGTSVSKATSIYGATGYSLSFVCC